MQLIRHITRVLIPAERREMIRLILLDIFINIVDILSLAFLLWVIKLYIEPAPEIPVRWSATLGLSPVLLIAFLVLLFGVKNWMGFLISSAQFKFISKVAVRVSGNALRNFQKAKFSEFVRVDSSTHIRNIAFHPFEFSQYILSGFQQIVTQLSLIVITISVILLFNAKLFLFLLLILLPPVILVSRFVKKRLSVVKESIRENNRQSFQYLLDALKGFVESNIYDRNEFFMERFVASRQRFSTHLFNSLALQTMPARIIEVFAVSGLFVLILIAQWADDNSKQAFITIGAFMAAAYKIIPGIVKIINIGGQIRAYEFSLDGTGTDKPEMERAIFRKSLPDIESISFDNVSFRYASNPVLNNVSFIVRKGELMGITGESGKGKTTLLQLLLGFLPPAAGSSILINGRRVETKDIIEYWPAIAYVRQQKFLIHDTLLKNITLDEGPVDGKKLESALHISGLDHLLLNLPGGLDEIIVENGKNLSGGQQQRIAIARALYKSSALIILDEPFNELDGENTCRLLKHFRSLARKGRIILMVTHDKNSLSFCDKILSLDQP